MTHHIRECDADATGHLTFKLLVQPVEVGAATAVSASATTGAAAITSTAMATTTTTPPDSEPQAAPHAWSGDDVDDAFASPFTVTSAGRAPFTIDEQPHELSAANDEKAQSPTPSTATATPASTLPTTSTALPSVSLGLSTTSPTEVFRTYQQCAWLHAKLADRFPHILLPPFPDPPAPIASADGDYCEKKRLQMERYFSKMFARSEVVATSGDLRYFLSADMRTLDVGAVVVASGKLNKSSGALPSLAGLLHSVGVCCVQSECARVLRRYDMVLLFLFNVIHDHRTRAMDFACFGCLQTSSVHCLSR